LRNHKLTVSQTTGNILAYLDPVSSNVGGDTPISVATFRERLGEPAFLVWKRIRHLRQENGTAWPSDFWLSNNVIHNGQPLGLDSTKYALKVLRKLGIVVSRGFRRIQYSNKSVVAFVRIIHGAFAKSKNAQDCISLPYMVYKNVMARKGNGGDRKTRDWENNIVGNRDADLFNPHLLSVEQVEKHNICVRLVTQSVYPSSTISLPLRSPPEISLIRSLPLPSEESEKTQASLSSIPASVEAPDPEPQTSFNTIMSNNSNSPSTGQNASKEIHLNSNKNEETEYFAPVPLWLEFVVSFPPVRLWLIFQI